MNATFDKKNILKSFKRETSISNIALNLINLSDVCGWWEKESEKPINGNLIKNVLHVN